MYINTYLVLLNENQNIKFSFFIQSLLGNKSEINVKWKFKEMLLYSCNFKLNNYNTNTDKQKQTKKQVFILLKIF